MNIREIFKKIAIETWYFLDNARSIDFQPGEETITDINLLKLQLEKHLEIIINKFTKPEEGTNGADWELWITGKSKKWLGLRMQAKIIDFKTNNFKQLHYKCGKEKNVLQTDKLIEHSKNDNAIPLYCLYTHCDLKDITDFRCRTDAGIYEAYGCSIIDAYRVKELYQKDKSDSSIKSLFPEMFPWHCLFCHFTLGDMELPETILSVLTHFRMVIAECKPSFIDINEHIKKYELLDDPPKYVDFIKNNPNSICKMPDEDLAGIIIIGKN
jgi:hypothetical protein